MEGFSQNMGSYLALDLGAESGRLMAVEIGSEISTREIYRFATPVVNDVRGRRCWDFPKIMQEIISALKIAAPDGPFLSIAVDTWGLDFGLLDINGKLIGLPVSHRDHRTDGYLKKASATVGKERLHGDTGSQLLEVNSIYQLLAITEQTPDELAIAHHLLLMPDLVLHALTGTIGTEYTIASTTGLYDVFNNRWATQLADDLGIPTNILGPVQDAGTIRGALSRQIQEQTGIGPIPCIATASHDTASAVVATPFKSPGNAYISSGTWSLLGVELDKPVINKLTLKYRLTNEGGFGRNTRLLCNIVGLWLIQEVRRDLKLQGVELTYAQLVELAEEQQAQDKKWRTLIYVDNPVFIHAGEMIARIQQFAKSTGQSIPTTPGELAQCIFASLALQYALIARILQECSGLPMPAIQIIGGGSQNALLSQLTADISGLEVIAGPIEATAMGNAIVQAIALGEISSIEEGRKIVKASDLKIKSYLPDQTSKIRSEVAALQLRYDLLIGETEN
jgi:rhamnulokinase